MNKFLFSFFMLLLSCAPVFAGPGHDHGGADDNASVGPLQEIVLTDAMIENLGIRTVAAVKDNVASSVDLLAEIAYLPEKQAIISALAEGSIASIAVTKGQFVQKGDVIAVLQPRLVGNPKVTLSTPIAGYVMEQNAVIGQHVAPDQILFRIADISRVIVRGKAYEDMPILQSIIGNPVIVTVSSLPNEQFDGAVQQIDAGFQSGTRLRDIVTIIDNPDGKLLANMRARMTVSIGDAHAALLVPQRAILGDNGNYFVYVQDKDHFYRRAVVLGDKFGLMREIRDGIHENEQVVVMGNYQLQFVTQSADAHNDDDNNAHSGHAH